MKLKDITLDPIEVGRDWSVTLQRGGEGIQIVSSTNASSIVVTTAKPHGYSNNDKVRIYGHDNTTANGNQTVSSVTTLTFTLAGVAGNSVGTRQGIVALCTDGTGTALTCKIKRNRSDANSAAIATPTVAWVTQNRFQFSLSLTAATTADLALGTYQFDVKAVDGAGGVSTVATGQVTVIDTVTD